MSMRTRTEIIADALQEILEGFTDEEYEQMASAIDLLDREQVGPKDKGLPRWKFDDICPKYLLDELAKNYLLDKVRRYYKPVFSVRKKKYLYGELEIDAQVYRELKGLLAHCATNVQVKRIVTDFLGLPADSDIATIEQEITTRGRVQHLRVYNAIYRELKRRGLIDTRFDYQVIQYRWLSALYRLSARGVSFLRRLA